MMTARILSPVLTLGPGRRIAVWVCGCKRRCIGCANPELWAFDSSKEISVEQLEQLIRSMSVHSETDGITITGGEPFDQPGELAALVRVLHKITGDILVYTGYTLAELNEMQDNAVIETLSRIAALIDGRYIEERNNGVRLRGSDNQVIHILNECYRNIYQSEIDEGKNEIQNFPVDGGVISVGIHKKGFRKELEKGLTGFGLEKIQND